SGLEHIRLGIRVLADEDVHLLEPENPLRFEPERTDVEIGAALEQRVPQVLAVRRREVELVAELADGADQKEEGRTTRHARPTRVVVGGRQSCASERRPIVPSSMIRPASVSSTP